MGSKKFEKHLNAAAEELFDSGGASLQFWWSGEEFIAGVIAATAKHVRKTGCHLFTDGEIQELKRLQKVSEKISGAPFRFTEGSTPEDGDYTEFHELFERWFTRLWD